jgi:hypothetical protein
MFGALSPNLASLRVVATQTSAHLRPINTKALNATSVMIKISQGGSVILLLLLLTLPFPELLLFAESLLFTDTFTTSLLYLNEGKHLQRTHRATTPIQAS